MKKEIGTRGFTLAEMFIVILLIVVLPALFCLISMWTGRNLDFWLTHLKGHLVHVPFWLDMILTIVLNGVILIANIIGEIARLAI